MTNQSELVHAEVALERQVHARFPVAEQEELAGYFRDYGADPDTAARWLPRYPATLARRCACTAARDSALGIGGS